MSLQKTSMLAALRRANLQLVSSTGSVTQAKDAVVASGRAQLVKLWPSAGRGSNKSPLSQSRLNSTTNSANEGSKATSSAKEAGADATSSSSKSIFEGMDMSAANPEAAAEAAEGAASGGPAKSGGYAGLALMGLLGGVGLAGYTLTSKDINSFIEGNKQSLPEPVQWAGKSYADWREGMEENVKQFSDPSSDKLLPELPPPAAQYMRTLVLDLDETLVHSDWRRERGWRTFKRPGVDEFLRYISQFYEVVVYTGQLSTYGDPIMERLDPNRYVPYRLYRDATLYESGKHYRDLKRLNRDLKKVLYISSDIKNCTCPENAIQIKPWKMEADDTTLLDLMPFLEMIVRSQLPDVRVVVDSYKGKDIPSEFRARTAAMKKNLQKKTNQPRLFSGPRGG